MTEHPLLWSLYQWWQGKIHHLNEWFQGYVLVCVSVWTDNLANISITKQTVGNSLFLAVTFEVCLMLRSMSRVLKQQRQRVISWWEKEWNYKEQQKRGTPTLETAKTWTTYRITTEKQFPFSLLSWSHTLPKSEELTEWVSLSAHSLCPTLFLSIHHWSLVAVGYKLRLTSPSFSYSSREGNKR